MENLFLMFESPIAMVIIGTLIGFIPNYFSNKQNNKHSNKMYIREKNHEAYLEFLILNKKIDTFNLLYQYGKQEEVLKMSEEIFALKEVVESKIDLYFNDDIRKISSKLFFMISPKTKKEAKEYHKKGKILIEQARVLMRNNLGIEE